MGRGRVGPLTIGVLVAGAVGVGTGLFWFQPWKLWQDEKVTEALPEVEEASWAPGANPGTSSPSPPPRPVTLASGELISHGHKTSGTVKLVRLADGSHVVRLENLDTSNGPDLRVWLTDAPVKPGLAGWHLFDDGEYANLGKLKGNKGSQNYGLPEDVDPSRYSSVSIWCDHFNVSFGAAELIRD